MNIRRAHDRFFRSFFGQQEHLRDLIRRAVPSEIIATLDLSTLKMEPGTWIDRHNREHWSDLVASVEVSGTDAPRRAHVYVLVEHKSYRDPGALLQLLRYMVQVWTAERKPKEKDDTAEVSARGAKLTPIIPILVYHGPRGGIVEPFSKLFPDDLPEELQRYQVAFGADILNLPRMRPDSLSGGDPAVRAALWMLRLSRRQTDELLKEVQAVLRGAEEALTEEEYSALARYIWETGELSVEDLYDKIDLVVHQRHIKEGLLTTAEQLIQKGYTEGEQIGIQKGEQIGIQKGEQIGIQKGEEDGRYRERREIALEMLVAGEDVEKIVRYSRLSQEEVRALSSDSQ
jgi:predicted transposase YdaD